MTDHIIFAHVLTLHNFQVLHSLISLIDSITLLQHHNIHKNHSHQGSIILLIYSLVIIKQMILKRQLLDQAILHMVNVLILIQLILRRDSINGILKIQIPIHKELVQALRQHHQLVKRAIQQQEQNHNINLPQITSSTLLLPLQIVRHLHIDLKLLFFEFFVLYSFFDYIFFLYNIIEQI